MLAQTAVFQAGQPPIRDRCWSLQALSSRTRPGGACENSPAIYRWETGSRYRTPVPEGRLNGSIVPAGRPNGRAIGNPAMNRWAILKRPFGTRKTGSPAYEKASSPPESLPAKNVGCQEMLPHPKDAATQRCRSSRQPSAVGWHGLLVSPCSPPPFTPALADEQPVPPNIMRSPLPQGYYPGPAK